MKDFLKNVVVGDVLIVTNTGEKAGKTKFELEVVNVTQYKIYTNDNFVMGCVSSYPKERGKGIIGWNKDDPCLDKQMYNSFKLESLLKSTETI